MNPLVSIIVPVYNVEKYLCRCIDSLVGQTYKNVEIILVDDGSTDNSGRICDEYRALFPNILVIHKTNGGLSSARNSGIDSSSGKYIGFVDSDDFIEPSMLQTLVEACEKEKASIACCGRYDVFEGRSKKDSGLCPIKYEMVSSEAAIQKLLHWDGLDSSSCDKLFVRSLFDSLRFPEGRISEDVAIMYILFEEAEKIILVPMRMYNYCHRANSITTTSFSEKKFDVITNVEDLHSFIVKKHPILIEDFLYFKCCEYSNLLYLMAFSNKRYQPIEKKLTKEIKTCRKVFCLFDRKKRRRLSFFTNRFCYIIFVWILKLRGKNNR